MLRPALPGPYPGASLRQAVMPFPNLIGGQRVQPDLPELGQDKRVGGIPRWKGSKRPSHDERNRDICNLR
jgi:hypothetical protein